jgi:hypothetical protein
MRALVQKPRPRDPATAETFCNNQHLLKGRVWH